MLLVVFSFFLRGSTSAKNTKTADILNLATGKKLKTNGFCIVVVVVLYFGWVSSFIRASADRVMLCEREG